MSTRTEYRDRLINTLADLATAREQIKTLRDALEQMLDADGDLDAMDFDQARCALDETK